MTEKPYQIVIRNDSQNPEDPYAATWGATPYRSVRDSLHDIAFRHSHHNTLPAKAEIVALGTRFQTLLLLIENSHKQLRQDAACSGST